MNRHGAWKRWVAVIVFAGMGMRAHGLINPNFTPVHLLRSSELVLLVRFGPLNEKKLACPINVVERFVPKKGPKGETLTLDLTYMREHQLPVLQRVLKAHGDQQALLFSGKGENDEEKGFLHLSGQWIELEKGEEEGVWEAMTTDAMSGEQGMGMEATWAGGTDMLIKVIRLLIEHPDLDVPSVGGTTWEQHMRIDTVPGRVHVMQAVDTEGKGESLLFVGAEQGDRLYAWDGDKQAFSNVASGRGLASRTRAGAWADFSGNGRLDLASWDGKSLALWVQGADGKFTAAAVKGEASAGNVVALLALDVGMKGRAGLLRMAADSATLLMPDADAVGTFAARPLKAEAEALAAMGEARTALVADFTNNGHPDILAVGPNGSLLFEGKGPGDFEAGRACPIQGGPGLSGAFTGDWNADGKLDVFTTSRVTHGGLWQNEGDGRFIQMLGLSGEIAYISQPGTIAGNTCDFNNDGRQDIFIAYGADVGPQLFFNRFFRSFGHAHQPVDIVELGVLPEVIKGQQAGVVADLTHNGAQDMAFAKNNGNIYVFLRDPWHGSRLGVQVTLPAQAGHAGPVRVWGDNGTFPLGAWSVQPGVGEALFGMEEPGEIVVHWQFPGRKPQRATRLVEADPIRIILSPGE